MRRCSIGFNVDQLCDIVVLTDSVDQRAQHKGLEGGESVQRAGCRIEVDRRAEGETSVRLL